MIYSFPGGMKSNIDFRSFTPTLTVKKSNSSSMFTILAGKPI